MRGRRGERLGSSVGTRYKPSLRDALPILSGGAHNSLRVPRPDPPLLPSIIFPLGPPFCGGECRAERALGCGGLFPRDQQAGATAEEAAKGRKCEGGAGNGSGRASVHDTNLPSATLFRSCQVGPTILFECPAQIPRSFLRSFSLWARHSAEASAELNVRSGAADFFPVTSRQVRRLRKRRREGNARAARGTARVERRYTIQTFPPRRSSDPVRWGPQFSSSAPPRSPAPSFDHFPFGPAICGDECRAERALGCGRIFPWGQERKSTRRNCRH